MRRQKLFSGEEDHTSGRVNQYLEAGWQVVHGTITLHSHGHELFLAMVLEKEDGDGGD